MSVRAFAGGAFAENAYLIHCPRSNHAVVVDPGAAAGEIVRALGELGAELDAVLLTHAHLDHVEGIPRLLEYQPDTPLHLHEADLGLYQGVPLQAAAFGVEVPPLPDPSERLSEGQILSVGATIHLEVRFTPGHSPGHVILVDHDSGLALVGDVVFQGSIGRTDLPGGDFRTLIQSIRERVLSLPDELRLLPGHGPETTVGAERIGNPFLVPNTLGRFA